MDPSASGPLRIDPDEQSQGLPLEYVNGVGMPDLLPGMFARRSDVDTKQEQLAKLLEAIGCEAMMLFMPSHVSWFTSGMNVRGLIADSERPGVYTNGKQRWLLCSNVDTHRLFDEELDQLGFQLKEWAWDGGRADLLLNVTAGRKVASDRPFPNMPMINDRLRPLLRILSTFEQEAYRELGKLVVHALEATARNITRGQTEEEVAGQVGHRLLHHGAEPVGLSVTADNRGEKFRRAGFTSAPIQTTCVIQATGQKDGLFVSASRTVSFGPPPDEFRAAFDHTLRMAAASRSLSRPDESMGTAKSAGQILLGNSAYEYDWRLSQPGYGAGRFPAEELRRAGQDERFAIGQALVWQPRVGPAAAVETVIVTSEGGELITAPEDWPFKRIAIRGRSFDVPDILVRNA